MSPVFRHGGLRLYLLKLLDEAPRHGYDVIRLLQDKFLGVYSPSPGTIYPRLARLEEEGLVTHETVDGKKVYRITDAGRAELNRRLDDLADLEDELAASVRDIAREISRDVRETVRNLRDELTWAVREAGRAGRSAGAASSDAAGGDAAGGDTGAGAGAGSGQGPDATASSARPSAPDGSAPTDGAATRTDQVPAADSVPAQDSGAWRAATVEADSATSAESTGEAPGAAGAAGAADSAGHAGQPGTADQATAASESQSSSGPAGGGGPASEPPPGREQSDETGERQDRRGRGDWRDWADDWREWVDWATGQGWGEWTGRPDWRERAKAGRTDWSEWTQTSRPDWLKGGGPRDRRDAGPDLMSDLERLAAAFTREIRGVARQAENVSDDAVGNLGRILFDTLNRIHTEVFRRPEPEPPDKDESVGPDDPTKPA